MDTREYSELCRDLSLLNVENIEALSETDASKKTVSYSDAMTKTPLTDLSNETTTRVRERDVIDPDRWAERPPDEELAASAARADESLALRLREATLEAKKKNEARAALNALLRENEITFTDRNARLYDTINAAF